MRLQTLLLTGGILLMGFVGLPPRTTRSHQHCQRQILGELPPGNKASFLPAAFSTLLLRTQRSGFSPAGETMLWTVLDRGQPAHPRNDPAGNNWSAPHAPAFADTSHDDFYPFSLPMAGSSSLVHADPAFRPPCR